jgi:hypothetical protein
MEPRETAVELTAGSVSVRAGFRIITASPLAGGPVELEFFIESLGSSPLHVAAGVSRAAQRPDLVEVVATFEGVLLDDPWRELPESGGPEMVLQVAAGSPLRQPLLLNDFVRLEETVMRVADGEEGRLDVTCRRPLPLADSEAATLMTTDAPMVAADLVCTLRRDDAALAALATALVREVMQGAPELRERPLAHLLSMRGAAREEIVALLAHPDPAVVDRARRVVEIQRLGSSSGRPAARR